MMFIAGTLPFNGCGQVRELREEHFVFWTLSLAKDVCCMHGRKNNTIIITDSVHVFDNCVCMCSTQKQDCDYHSIY